MIICIYEKPLPLIPRGVSVWRLNTHVTYDCAGRLLRVPSGFNTDGASVGLRAKGLLARCVNAALRLVFPRRHPKYDHAVLLRDFLYATTEWRARDLVSVTLGIRDERKAADVAFRDLIVGWRKWPMYWAVRLTGAPAWLPPSRSLQGSRV